MKDHLIGACSNEQQQDDNGEGDMVAAAAMLDAADAKRRESVAGTVVPFSTSVPTTDFANLLESHHGPVAQTDRAAVS
jgi:hypothetical protein